MFKRCKPSLLLLYKYNNQLILSWTGDNNALFWVFQFGFVLLHFLDLILAKNGIYFNPFLGLYISFVPKYQYNSALKSIGKIPLLEN